MCKFAAPCDHVATPFVTNWQVNGVAPCLDWAALTHHMASSPCGKVAKVKSDDMEVCRRRQLTGDVTPQQLLEHLRGKAMKYSLSRVGCVVAAQLVTALPCGSAGAFVDELLGSVLELAQHRYGHRVAIAVLQHHCIAQNGAMDGTGAVFVEELLQHAPELLMDAWGHRVIVAALQHCGEDERRVLGRAVLAQAVACAEDSFGSQVVVAALEHCAAEQRDAVADELVGFNILSYLAEGPSGSRMARIVMKYGGEPAEALLEQLQDAVVDLVETRHGRRLLTDLNLYPKA